MLITCCYIISLIHSFGHPSEQHLPKEASLVRWYLDILSKAYARGTICEVTNLVDEQLQGRFNQSYVYVLIFSSSSFINQSFIIHHLSFIIIHYSFIIIHSFIVWEILQF